MSFGSIANSEIGSSARTKLNAVMAFLDRCITRVNVSTVTVADGAGATTLFSSAFSIAANTLQVGDVIILEAWGEQSSSPTVDFRLKLGGIDLDAIFSSLGGDWHYRAVVTVRTIGTGSTLIHVGVESNFGGVIGSDFNSGLSSTSPIAVDLTVSPTSGDVICNQLILRIIPKNP